MTEHHRKREMNVLVDPAARPVIAHRGASAHAPENSIEAFAKAFEVGADAIELDVRITRDDAVVVIHDPHVDRTTSRRGMVAAMSLAELRSLDAGASFTRDEGRTYPFRERGVRIATFDEVLGAFPRTPLLVEIKEARAAAAAVAIVRRHGAEDRVVLASELDEAMRLVRPHALLTGASRPDAMRLLRRACLGLAPRALPYQVLSIPWRVGVLRVPMSRMCRIARRAQVPTHAWTVNAGNLAMRLWRAGVSGIVTDDPAEMLRVRSDLEK